MTDLSRRQVISRLAQTCLGVTAAPAFLGQQSLAAFAGASTARQVATAKNVIYLYMSGGMSHMDTFDPHPGIEEAGDLKAISTKVDGIQLSEYLPKLAQHTDKMAILRGLNSSQGAHEQGNYFMHTSYEQRSSIRHPSMGSWLTKFQGRSNPSLPSSVVISGSSKHPCAGFFEAAVAPLSVNNPAQGLQNVKRQQTVTETDFDYRLKLSGKLDQHFRQTYEYKNISAYKDVYTDAVKIMNSEDLKAFNISQEPITAHTAYGSEPFGQGCLLARRLVEHGVRFVEVELGGWDTHNENFVRVEEQTTILDQGMSALLADLEQRGMLEDTLVVLTTEFGRSPKINTNEGRDHWPKAFSSVLVGGGIRGGQVHGATDHGMEVKEGKIGIPDFNATIGYALGIPLDTVIFSPSKRPFTVCDKGQPLTQLFA
jgi:hypothetical protein